MNGDRVPSGMIMDLVDASTALIAQRDEWRKAAEAALGELAAAVAERDAAWTAYQQLANDLDAMTRDRDDWRRRAGNHSTRVKALVAAGDFLVTQLRAEHAVAGDNACDGDCAVNRACANWSRVRST